MMTARNSNLTRITAPAPSLGMLRGPNLAKVRAKRLTCKTCRDKVCVGRCRFAKTN